MEFTDEAALVERCQNGDMEAFTGLYDHYITPIYRFLQYRTFDHMLSEDLASVTFLKALEKIGKYDAKKGPFAAWLYSIARNTLTDHFRTSHPTTELPEEWEAAGDEDATSTTERHLTQKEIRDALAQLEPLQRDIVILRMWDGLSHAEIAHIVGTTEGNSKVIFSRTLKELRGKVTPLALLLFLTLPSHL